MKTKNDIKYKDFLEFHSYMEGMDESELETKQEELTTKMIATFFPGGSLDPESDLIMLQTALEITGPINVINGYFSVNGSTYFVDFDMNNWSAEKFIDMETFLKEKMYKEFFQKLITRVPKWYEKLLFWRTPSLVIPFEDITLGVYFELTEEYKKRMNEIKLVHEWIYNPPPTQEVSSKSEGFTLGDEYRKEFRDFYGGYMELMYLISNGDITKWDSIGKYPTSQFLFQGEYLLRKSIIEKMK